MLSLHRLLWDHQEKIGTYLATKRLVMKIIYPDATTLQLGNEMNKTCIEFYSFLKNYPMNLWVCCDSYVKLQNLDYLKLARNYTLVR